MRTLLLNLMAAALFAAPAWPQDAEPAPVPAPAADGENEGAADGEAINFDMEALGNLLGGGGAQGPQPAWMAKLQEVQTLLQATYEAIQDESARDAALENLKKVVEITSDPEIPARQIAEFVYITGFMYQQLGAYDEAEKSFNRMIDLAGQEGMESFGGDALKGVALAQLAEMASLQQGQPEAAMAHFDRALALADLPAELRSTLLSRAFDLRMSAEKLFDKATLSALARAELVWSAFAPRPNAAPNARLPGHLAAAAALDGRADEARAILAIVDDERGLEDEAAGEMALSVAYAFAALDDAAGAARWLGKELETRAMNLTPKDFLRYHAWLAGSYALRTVAGQDAVKAVFDDYRAKAEAAAEAKKRTVVEPPPPVFDPSAFGG